MAFFSATRQIPLKPIIPIALAIQENPNIELGRQVALDNGIYGNEWECAYKLIQKESGWSETATNKMSGAYGLPQALPASKLDTYGDRNDPKVQLHWFFDYVSARYNTPCQAWAFSGKNNWY